MSARGSSSPHRCFPLICGVVLAQRGPAFPRKIDMTIDARSGLVVVQSTDEHGRDEHFDEHMDLPDNLANGLVPILLKNATSAAPLKSLSLLVATPKPRLVKLAISSHVWILEGRAPGVHPLGTAILRRRTVVAHRSRGSYDTRRAAGILKGGR